MGVREWKYRADNLNEEIIMKNEEVMNNKDSSFFILHSILPPPDTEMKKEEDELKAKIGIITAILMIGVALLIFAGVKRTGVYHLTVAELASQRYSLDEDSIKINGRIVVNSTQWDSSKPELSFSIADTSDESKTVSITYLGFKPDSYRENQTVVIEGRYEPDKNLIIASKIMTQCPSKYESDKENYSQ